MKSIYNSKIFNKKYVFCVSMLLLFLMGMGKYAFEKREISHGNLNRDDLVMVVPSPSEKDVEYAKAMKNGYLTLEGTSESIQFTIDDFDWNQVWENGSRTAQLNLQGLEPVRYLTNAYELHPYTGIGYLNLGLQLIYSWIDFSKSEFCSKNEYVWSEHSVSKRCTNLIYFYLMADSANCLTEEDKIILQELIIEQGEWLNKDDYYVKKHNHGLIQDQALIICALFLNEEVSDDWMQHAAERAEEQLSALYSSEMVNMENSITYAIYDIELLVDICRLLEKGSITTSLPEKILKAEDIIPYFIMPNGEQPQFGDSNRNSTLPSILLNNGYIEYVNSFGKNGEQPETNSQIYPEAGYYVARQSWETENFKKSAWVLFKSGFGNISHKHADDNSFIYYAKGSEIFTDSGYYDYTYDELPRKYLVSARACLKIMSF